MSMDVAATLKLGFDGLGGKLDGLDKMASDLLMAERDRYRGVKWMRLPLLQGLVTASGISIGENIGAGEGQQQRVAPDEGYAWSIRRLCVTGLTFGATPDVVNIWRSSSAQQGGFLWQLNGNSPGSTFGVGEITLFPGDSLAVVSQGTVGAAVGTLITISGEGVSTPAEMFAKQLTH
jgi:hypothetical protein